MSKRERLVSRARVISKISAGVSDRPTWVSMRVACAAILSPFFSVPRFHLDRAREQDVVLQVNVLMEVGFKICQSFVQRLVADAGVVRRCVPCAGLTHRAQSIAGGVVLMHHHRHGILHGAERWTAELVPSG